MDFSKRLKQSREMKKKESSIWTQGYLADKIGVARTTYTAYERGTKTPPLETVNKIATLLEVSTDYLLGRTDKPNYAAEQESTNSEEYDSIQEINRLLKEYGIDQSGFFDIELWKAMGPEEIKQLESYFKFITEEAKKKNQD